LNLLLDVTNGIAPPGSTSAKPLSVTMGPT
jgi:hypothetical protein